jgi:hypothetical protein
MRYDRALTKDFAALLTDGGELRPLVGYCQKLWGGRNLVPDLQLRERNKVGIYLGLTRVLELQMGPDGSIKPTASDTYRIDEHGVAGRYGPEQYEQLRRDVLHYLDAVEVRETYLTGEGRCQNWLSYRYGPNHKVGQGEPLSIDREVVIGYQNQAEKKKLWDDPIRQPALGLAATISRDHPELFGKDLHLRSLGNELDLLAWEPPNTFLCVEAKCGANAHGIYMAPLQVAAYTVAWRDSDWSALKDGVKRLVQQKRDLGLVSMSDSEYRTFEDGLRTPRFVPAIVIQDPKRRSSCWKRLAEVLTHIADGWPESLGDNPLESLRIYSVDGSEDRLRDVTLECMTW